MASSTTGAAYSSSDTSRLHVTTQTLTLGRADINDDYYTSAEDDEETPTRTSSITRTDGRRHHHLQLSEQEKSAQAVSPSRHSWWQRLPNPFHASTSETTTSPDETINTDIHTAPDDVSYLSLNGVPNSNNIIDHPHHNQLLQKKQERGPLPHRLPPLGQQAPLVSELRYNRFQPVLESSASDATTTTTSHTTASTSLIPSHHDASLSTLQSAEEELARGSFFFRQEEAEDLPSKKRSSYSYASPSSLFRPRSSFQTLLLSSRAHTQEFAYRDAAALHVALAPPVLSSYRAKYELLNRHLEREGGNRHYASSWVDDDLSEDEGGHGCDYYSNIDYDLDLMMDTTSSTNDRDTTARDAAATTTTTQQKKQCMSPTNLSKFPKTDSCALSSLLYRSDRGRILLKLPHDQVRLVMDPDLQPGVLSVEQWRRCEQEYAAETSRPSLHYVLTVPEDLYRKIVGEMSDSLTNPYCGMQKCCSEKEFVDIRVAVAIVVATLTILLLLTFEWPVS